MVPSHFHSLLSIKVCLLPAVFLTSVKITLLSPHKHILVVPLEGRVADFDCATRYKWTREHTEVLTLCQWQGMCMWDKNIYDTKSRITITITTQFFIVIIFTVLICSVSLTGEPNLLGFEVALDKSVRQKFECKCYFEPICACRKVLVISCVVMHTSFIWCSL